MNRERLSHLAHARHPVACPFSDATVDALVDRLVLPDAASVLDVGCGRGEWLVRVLERHGGARAVGVDNSKLALDAAAERATAVSVSERLTLVHGDAAAWLRGSEATRDLITCAGAEHALGGTAAAWKTLRSRLAPGGVLLVAQGFWTEAPTPSVLDLLGANLADLPIGLPALVDGVAAHDLTPLHATVSTQREWDDYEWSWVGSLEEHADAHPADADELRAIAASHREAYLRGYRGVLGYAAILARRAEATP